MIRPENKRTARGSLPSSHLRKGKRALQKGDKKGNPSSIAHFIPAPGKDRVPFSYGGRRADRHSTPSTRNTKGARGPEDTSQKRKGVGETTQLMIY